MPTAGSLNPWREKGIPLEKQYRSWRQMIKTPFDKRDVDAYTRTRVILMNGIENECIAYSHNFARSAGDQAIRSLLAQTRRAESQQQMTINWLNPADASVLETTIAYEQVAIDLTAYLARNEPDPYVREAFNFGLLEDFDHLYRYAELLDYLEGKDANTILQGQTEILPGRPTADHHNDPVARLRKHYEKNRALPLSKIHVLTLLAGEQQTMNFYRTVGPLYGSQLARDLYAEIGEVEEEHVTQYESLMDPTGSCLERQVLHELVEVYNYFHCYQQETDARIRAVWDEFLHMELTHLQLWGDMLRHCEGVEPEALFGEELTVEFKFQENKEYVREVLAQQRDLRMQLYGYTTMDQVPAETLRYQAIVHADGIPSEQVVNRQVVQLKERARPGDEMLERARELALQTREASTAPVTAKA